MFTEIKNIIDFNIRNFTKFSRKNFVETDLSAIKQNEKENLYTYEILRRYFSKNHTQKLKILDIGSKNWFYAKGEHQFFNEFSQDFELHGVEIDAYRLYSNFYSRYEVAKYHTKDLSNTHYFAKNLLTINEKYDYIIWFLPFITISPLISWGLPKSFFCPEKLLAHAYHLLKNNGEMLIINQGKIEANEQEKLFQKLAIPYKNLGIIKSDFWEYKKERYGWLVEKK